MRISNETLLDYFPGWTSRVSDDTWYFGALLRNGKKVAFSSAEFYVYDQLKNPELWVKLELLDDLPFIKDGHQLDYFIAPTSRTITQVRYSDIVMVWELADT